MPAESVEREIAGADGVWRTHHRRHSGGVRRVANGREPGVGDRHSVRVTDRYGKARRGIMEDIEAPPLSRAQPSIDLATTMKLVEVLCDVASPLPLFS